MAAFPQLDWSSLRKLLFPAVVAPDVRTPTTDRLAILVLSGEWLLFGALHFAWPEIAMREIPPWIPAQLQPFLVTSSGILEVTTGTIVLIPNLRRLGALLSIFLLIVLTPAMYHILSNDSALPYELVAPLPMLFRILLLPNNIYLLVLSAYLCRHSDAALASPAKTARMRSTPTVGHPIRLLTAFMLFASNCAGFLTLIAGVRGHFAEASLWAMTCIAFGAMLGFLFAVPRVNVRAAARKDLSPNTNIETVSDWLTKTLIGVGLINFTNIGGYITTLSGRLGGALHIDEDFALALLVYFFVLGLIEGYLLTRTFLYEEFASEPG
jgi:uncharacterized membrane protein